MLFRSSHDKTGVRGETGSQGNTGVQGETGVRGETDIQMGLFATNTNYEWLICYTSSGVLKQYCPDEEIKNLLPLIYAGL